MADVFGEELRRWRERAGFSLADLAGRVHYTKGHLSNVENGRKHATIELAERCDAVLGAEGHLIGLIPARPARISRAVKPAQLPAGISYFVGRSATRAQLDSVLTAATSNETTPIIAIDGEPGVGKTALVIRWAHDRADRFPDGILFADLRGYSPDDHAASPEDILDQFLRALGVSGSSIPTDLTARAALFRTLLDDQRVLVVLDNAATTEQVRPLLPGSTECLTVITSRSRLSGLAVREGATRLTLRPLPPSEAVSLLRNIVGDDRIDAEPDAAELLAARCAYVPLALRIAAERAASRPDTTLAELAENLADETNRLDALAVGDDESSAIRTVFSWSYRSLAAESARMYRYISAHPGPDIAAPAAAVLAGVPPSEAVRILDQLASVHLLDEYVPNRYQFPTLLHAYATERLGTEEPPSARTDAVNRVLTWYLHSAANAGRAIGPHQRHLTLAPHETPEPLRFVNRRAALTWCDTELENLVSAVHAAETGQPEDLAWQLPLVLGVYFDLRKAWWPWITTHHVGLSVARRQADRVAEAWLLANLAGAYTGLRRLDEARDLLEESLALQREVGDQRGEALSLLQLGQTFTALASFDKALARYREALQILPDIEDHHGEATALLGVSEVYHAADQDQLAREPGEVALAIFRRLGDRRGEGAALDGLAASYHGLGYLDEAVTEFDHALEAWRDADDRFGEAVTLHRKGKALLELGDQAAASAAWRDALSIFDNLNDPDAAEVRAHLHKLGACVALPNGKAC